MELLPGEEVPVQILVRYLRDTRKHGVTAEIDLKVWINDGVLRDMKHAAVLTTKLKGLPVPPEIG
jgi:hypothetical protein